MRDDYDLVFVDCAPGVSLVSDAVMRASDLVLVPTIPTTLSLRTYAQLRTHARAEAFGAAIVPFFSMADRRRRLHRDIMVEFASRSPECSRIFIPYATQVEQMGPRRMPVTAFAPISAPARAFEQLWGQVAPRLGVDGLTECRKARRAVSGRRRREACPEESRAVVESELVGLDHPGGRGEIPCRHRHRPGRTGVDLAATARKVSDGGATAAPAAACTPRPRTGARSRPSPRRAPGARCGG